MNKERIIELLARKKAGSITLAERKQLKDLLKQGEGAERVNQVMEEMHRITFRPEIPHIDESLRQSKEKLFEKIGNHGEGLSQKRGLIVTGFGKIVAAAAIVILGLGVAFFLLQQNTEEPAAANIVHVKKGSKTNIVLPDGSGVWVNSDSRITYDSDFGKTIREVHLTGEAYFDVVRDTGRPFIVHTEALDIKVLGTTFNVRAYSDEASTQAVLIKGSVEVLLKRNDKERIILKPNEKIIVQNNYSTGADAPGTVLDAPKVAIMNVLPNAVDSTTREVQWLRNRLVFDQDLLRDIIPILEKWYGVTITVQDSSLMDRRISGAFENEGLTEVLESFKFAIKFDYKIENNHVKLYKRR